MKVLVAAISGVPLITPEGDKLSPAGRLLPAANDQVYGCTPPVAANVAEYGTFTAAVGQGSSSNRQRRRLHRHRAVGR